MDKKTLEDLPVVSIEDGLQNLKVVNLSKHASDIRYIKLETNKKCLVTQNIEKIYVEDSKIFVYDDDSFIKVFDAKNGKYLYNIGRKGNGPGELPVISEIDVVPNDRIILLEFVECLKYDFDGNFLGSIPQPESPDSLEKLIPNIVILGEGLYACGVKCFGDKQVNASVIFNDKLEIINTLKSYKDPIQYDNRMLKAWSKSIQMGYYYRAIDRVHFYREISDTIYEYDPATINFQPYICLDFGKHKSNHSFIRDSENKDVITIHKLSENNKALYMDLLTARASPEPFEEDFWRSGMGWRKLINNFVYAIYDKDKKEINCLLQPIPGIRGMKNDIDQGIPFWPKNISSSNELIDYHHGYKFLEYIDKMENLSEELKEFVSTIQEDDNPIVIVAKGL